MIVGQSRGIFGWVGGEGGAGDENPLLDMRGSCLGRGQEDMYPSLFGVGGQSISCPP